MEALQGLRNVSPSQPITLEIHESAATEASKMRGLQSALADLGMKWAYDDFGAGQDRLVQLVEVRPDYIKFDMGLIRGIDQAAAARQTMLETLVKMVLDLGIVALAEGVETAGEGRHVSADRLPACPRLPLRQAGSRELHSKRPGKTRVIAAKCLIPLLARIIEPLVGIASRRSAIASSWSPLR